MEKPDLEDCLEDCHTLPDMYDSGVFLLVCDFCGYWQLVKDVWEHGYWRSSKEIPCPCSICKKLGKPGMLQVVQDDDELKIK
jgi:hypothetical protein